MNITGNLDNIAAAIRAGRVEMGLSMLENLSRNIRRDQEAFPVVKSVFCLPVDLDKVRAFDFEADEAEELYLSERIDALDGCRDTDYNGHFGHYIWITIETEYDSAKLRATITAMLAPFRKDT